CLEPSARVISRWKNGNYYKGEIDSITNRVNVLFDNGVRLAYSPRDNVDIVVDRIPDHSELPWGSQILVNRPRSRAFEIGYIRDIKNGRFVILYENGEEIMHTLDQLRVFNKSRICVCFLPDEPAYLGCFRDNIPRDLQVYIPTRPATIGACVDTCKSQGFSIGALRNSDLCFCGNSYSKSNQVEEKACDMPCYDNSYEVCGGFMTFSQYWTGERIVDSPTQRQPQSGLQKHLIPSNHPIPWELLMHGKALYAPYAYQRYRQYYGSKASYAPYRPVPYKWPYNNDYKNRNYNLQSSAMAKPLSDLSSPRFMGCFQDSAARDLPTEIDVRPLTVEGCVFKCGRLGFSMAGAQSSSLCFCGTTYSRYGRLRNEQCNMRCTGNYKEICGGFLRSSLYYTGVGQAIPYFTKFGPRTQKITFIKNDLLKVHTNTKQDQNTKAFKPMKDSSQKTTVKVPNNKEKSDQKMVNQAKDENDKDKGKPITIEDYGKLTQILQTLSRWQQKAPELHHSDGELSKKPLPHYQELRKVLKELTPEIVKDVATKIMAAELNKTRLRDMKPLKAVHSLEVNMAASRGEKRKYTGVKRVKVHTYKNWSKKNRKGKNQHGDIILKAGAKVTSSAKHAPTIKRTPLKNAGTADASQVLSKNAIQSLHEAQSVKNTKTSSPLSIADKGKYASKNASEKSKASAKGTAKSKDRLKKLASVHSIVSESKNNKKMEIPKSKVEPSGNQRQSNKTESTGGYSHSQVKETSPGKNGTKMNGTRSDLTPTASKPIQDVEEVFETFGTPSNDADVKNSRTNLKKTAVKKLKKVPQEISVQHKHKVLHVEAKWKGQINVKANWKDDDETDLETKHKHNSLMTKSQIKPTKTATNIESERSGEEDGEEYNFDDSGSRNDLIWRNRRLKRKVENKSKSKP
ncbi:WSC domain-containing protein, partial [Acropora cervicornis]